MLNFRALFVFAFVTVFAALSGMAQTNNNRASVELISERSIAVPGETVWLGLSFEIDQDWHIYWINPGDAGIPPEILWGDTLGVDQASISAFEWPLPEVLPVVPGQIMDYGYSDKVILPFKVQIPESADSAIMFEGIADYLICKDICIPESAPISFLQSVGTAQMPDTASSKLIQDALAEVPPVFSGESAVTATSGKWVMSLSGEQVAGARGEVRFFPYGHDIVHAADQPVSFGEEGLQIELTPSKAGGVQQTALGGVVQVGDVAVEVSAGSGAILANTSGLSGEGSSAGVAAGGGAGLPMLMVLGLIGGLILNLMPCVLPVLSIKAMGIVSSVANGNVGEARAHGLWYAAGVLVSFGALAAAVLSVRAATGVAIWGFWLQNPLIVTALILIIFLIGLWLLGMFELGSSVQNVGGNLAAKQGSTGAFFTGVLAAVVGAPCTGPFLGAALGAVMLQPSLNVVLVLLSMGVGLALPFLLLSFLPSLQRLVPKPGAWMESLKEVFAFPMFLTAAWLISVLGSLSGYRVAAAVVAGAALIGFALWALKAADKGGRAILMAVLGLLTIIPVFGLMSALSATAFNGIELAKSAGMLIGMLTAIWVVANLKAGQASLITRAAAVIVGVAGIALPMSMANAAVEFEGGSQAYAASYETEEWSPERVAELTAEGRAVFVDFTAEWCVTCQANKLQTLQTKPVTEAFEEGEVAFLVADFTNGDTEIALELQKRGRAGVPMYLWYAPGETEPEVLPELLSIDLVTGLVEAG